ncbi:MULTISPECIES: hypothetical protein [Arthrobacter]|uniref:Uncharacterized protein n=1 Tax=Arthrobacter sunyaminii TaxID=2816859 RepID=A0A975S719_9MICC|nr:MULTISPECIES: hypothetical protein [Arthrobacter]MBO0907937.1 hypothetical protein [Arthrobacter sunyaminii]QWQ36986.1 hypothetical protein KG104_04095 [Arthrobacter sunyaminii]
MKQINERVQLPDANEQYLVHPLDLAQARRPFLLAWVMGIIGSPQVFAAVAALVWVGSNNFVVPFIAAGSTMLFANLAAAWFRREAWSNIPGKRRDSDRRLLGLNLLAAVVQALALAAAAVVLILWFINRTVSPEVAAFATGTVTAITVLMAVDMVATAVRSRSGTAALAPAVNLLVVAAVSWWGFLVIAGRTGPLDVSTVIMGAAVLLAVWGLWLIWSLWQRRRIARGPTGGSAASAA